MPAVEGRTAVIRRLAMVLLYTNTCHYRPTLKTMARGLNVSERTARRYLDALEEVGWPMPKRRRESA